MKKLIVGFFLIATPVLCTAKAWPWPLSQHCQNAYMYKTGLVKVAISPTETSLNNVYVTGDLLDLSGQQVSKDIEKVKRDPSTPDTFQKMNSYSSSLMKEEIAKCEKNPESYIPNYKHLSDNALIQN